MASCASARLFARSSSDLARISRNGAVALKAGPGGRSSVSGRTVTVFGCTGFIGRYLVNRLGQIGTQVVLPWRGYEDSKRHLKLMGDLGQIQPLHFDIYNEKEIAECVRHSDVVFNLIGRDYRTKNFTFENVHVDATRNLARICREEGVPRFVQLSHLSASVNSPSDYLRTKAEAEEVAREVFSETTIVRCATVYGHEDRFLHWIGWLSNFPALPVLNNGHTLFRPVSVSDVATALANIAFNPTVDGKTAELYGPKVYTLDEIMDIWMELTCKPLVKVYPPAWVSRLYSRFVDSISPYPKLTPDLITRMNIDEHPTVRGALTLPELGAPHPAILEYAALEYIRRYRKHADYHLPGRIPTPAQRP